MTDFEKLVKKMRDTQKEFYRYKSRDTLRQAKALEYEVDKALAAAATRDDQMQMKFPLPV